MANGSGAGSWKPGTPLRWRTSPSASIRPIPEPPRISGATASSREARQPRLVGSYGAGTTQKRQAGSPVGSADDCCCIVVDRCRRGSGGGQQGQACPGGRPPGRAGSSRCGCVRRCRAGLRSRRRTRRLPGCRDRPDSCRWSMARRSSPPATAGLAGGCEQCGLQAQIVPQPVGRPAGGYLHQWPTRNPWRSRPPRRGAAGTQGAVGRPLGVARSVRYVSQGPSRDGRLECLDPLMDRNAASRCESRGEPDDPATATTWTRIRDRHGHALRSNSLPPIGPRSWWAGTRFRWSG
jgi:hypothetical protein